MADPKKQPANEGGDEILDFNSGVGEGTYDASKLGKLEGLEAVRKKPGMYIGGTDERALHHCISEVLDNSGRSGPAMNRQSPRKPQASAEPALRPCRARRRRDRAGRSPSRCGAHPC